MYLPTRDTANGLFDHYLAVRPPSAGTTCYHHRCATLTGREHRCKVKHRGRWGRQPGDEPKQCWHSNPSPRRHNHRDQLGGQSTGLLFYIRTAISPSTCEARRVFTPVLEGCLLNVGGHRQRSMWSKVENIWRSSQSKENKLCQVGLLDSPPPPPPPLSPETCRDDLQINSKIGSAAGEPPFHLWLCVRPVLVRSCLCRFDDTYVCVCVFAADISDHKS